MRMLTKDGQTFEGSAIQILEQMRALASHEASTTDEYIDHVAANVERMESQKINVVGTTTEERAESLLKEMARIGMSELQ